MPLEDFLNQTASIVATDTTTQDALGGLDRDAAPVALASGIPCCVRPLSAITGRVNDQSSMDITHKVYFAKDPLAAIGSRLTRRHQILIGSRVFNVRTPIDPNEMGRLLQVECTEDVE
jgi:hypothetical protein